MGNFCCGSVIMEENNSGTVGFFVFEVAADSPASKGGLVVNSDVIIAVNGIPLRKNKRRVLLYQLAEVGSSFNTQNIKLN
jgi:C-terminal processing protease CtpA/Prc